MNGGKSKRATDYVIPMIQYTTFRGETEVLGNRADLTYSLSISSVLNAQVAMSYRRSGQRCW
jgi:hypothetical protein